MLLLLRHSTQASILGVGGVATPRFCAGAVVVGSQRVVAVVDGAAKHYNSLSCTLYRKYVRKWWLFKRSRIICPEFSCKWQFAWIKRFLLSFRKLALKNRKFSKICLKNEIFRQFGSEICLKKLNFFTRIHEPQISNQIHAVDTACSGIHIQCSIVAGLIHHPVVHW